MDERDAEVTQEWLDGPKLAAWLEEHADLRWLSDNRKRTIRHMRAGCAVRLSTADRLLVDLSIHLHELPDELWRDSPPQGARYPEEVRERAVCAVREGQKLSNVARAFGVSYDSVRKWAKTA